jgi:SAM-dependent methyltransferase
MPYFLPDGYVERLGAPQSYDAGGSGDWQREVYATAHQLACALGLWTVIDVGCGSGYKLISQFGGPEFHTIGVDLLPAVERLCRLHPEHIWCTVDQLITVDREPPDLLICADVLEHVDEPDRLIEVFKTLRPKWLVISTPDRTLMAKYPKWGRASGPPSNGCHVREWSFSEFRQYIGSHFDIIRHFHSNIEQCTQCAIVRIRQ